MVFSFGSVLQLCTIAVLLHGPVLCMLTFETPMEVCDGEGRYCYLQAYKFIQILISYSPVRSRRQGGQCYPGPDLAVCLGAAGKDGGEGTGSP